MCCMIVSSCIVLLYELFAVPLAIAVMFITFQLVAAVYVYTLYDHESKCQCV